ncbi:helix-turn-helix transcriptional regulator [Nocardioides anomalus]|uniref:Helix-turn-helix transcriptional regulator n=2 Tax=Nocardioides anomalus TaxID=2712223 RepID=A0A6G6WI26_9ACTN|nr:helix-turn-helix transcriptional regulator [Nocardioides anomalus]
MPTMTAAQRRAADKAEYDAFLAACPSRQLLDRLSDKWVTLVLVGLEEGPRRYSELSRTIAGVSQKMLTQTLRTLERDGLLTRTVTASVPVTVTYELTPLGRSLQQLMAQLKDWAEAHMDQVLTARDSYDAQP